MTATAPPRFLRAGECALVVEYGSAIDPIVHAEVMALDAALAETPVAGLLETVPTYRSLMVHYDPLVIGETELMERIRALHPLRRQARAAHARWTLPICYAPRFAEDLSFVAASLGLAEERVVALHTGALYRLYMYGFAPGFAYLGGLPAELTISRRAEPRPRLDPNKAIIAGGQAIITTVAMPNAWHVLGETPLSLFDPRRTPVFLLDVADEVRFEAIGEAEFEVLRARAAGGEVVARREAVR